MSDLDELARAAAIASSRRPVAPAAVLIRMGSRESTGTEKNIAISLVILTVIAVAIFIPIAVKSIQEPRRDRVDSPSLTRPESHPAKYEISRMPPKVDGDALTICVTFHQTPTRREMANTLMSEIRSYQSTDPAWYQDAVVGAFNDAGDWLYLSYVYTAATREVQEVNTDEVAVPLINQDRSGGVHVRGYVTKSGKVVRGYTRRK